MSSDPTDIGIPWIDPHHTCANSIVTQVKELFANMPDHHGVPHLRRIVAHVKAASAHLNAEQKFILRSAAWLHEVDDEKLQRWIGGLPPPTTPRYGALPQTPMSRTEQILYNAKVGEIYDGQVFDSIWCATRLVTTSKQAQVEAEVGPVYPWMLIVRDADRLDALDVQRCVDYGRDVGTPLFVETTPRPSTVAEMLSFATPERFAAYKAGAKSASTIDHFYDKLLHINCDDSGAEYFVQKSAEARKQMIEDLFALICEKMPPP